MENSEDPGGTELKSMTHQESRTVRQESESERVPVIDKLAAWIAANPAAALDKYAACAVKPITGDPGRDRLNASVFRMLTKAFDAANADSLRDTGRSIYEVALPALADRTRASRQFDYYDARRFQQIMPYRFEPLKDGAHLPVGRNYKPLRRDGDGFYDYEMFANEAWRFRVDPREIPGVFVCDGLYLYDDGTCPNTLAEHRHYLARVGRLLGAADDGFIHAALLVDSLPKPKPRGR